MKERGSILHIFCLWVYVIMTEKYSYLVCLLLRLCPRKVLPQTHVFSAQATKKWSFYKQEQKLYYFEVAQAESCTCSCDTEDE